MTAPTHHGPGLDCRSDRRVFAWSDTARRVRDRKRSQTFEPVAIPSYKPRPMTLKRAWKAIWPSLLGVVFLLWCGAMFFAWMAGVKG